MLLTLPSLGWKCHVHKPVLLVMAVLSMPACAKVFNTEQGRLQLAPLEGLMSFHAGDDPRWSEPGIAPAEVARA
jgi:hypothetical protein